MEFNKTVFMNDVYRAGRCIPYGELLVPQKRRNVITRYRAGAAVYTPLPAGEGGTGSEIGEGMFSSCV